ncbi:hypothetical protein M9458_021729, partial [Cirrhinus mrigala]
MVIGTPRPTVPIPALQRTCSPMDSLAAKFTSFACKDLSLLEYAVEFSQLAVLTAFDDAALNSLFWIGVNYFLPINLPDTTGLSWKEAIIRCLESIYLQSGTHPDPAPSPSSPRYMECMPELTADGEPLLHGATKQRIATELELQLTLVQVRELVTMPATRKNTVASEITEWSSTHCNMAEGELTMDLDEWK